MLKLCQIVSQTPNITYYLEDSNGNILINNIETYPAIFEVEVIDWVNEEEYKKRGKINSFHAESVIIESAISNIRQYVFDNLINKYPELII